jgi:UDP-glucose 4-epimerase
MADAVLVFGAGGLVGEHLVRALAGKGEHVIAISRSALAHSDPRVESCVASLRDAADFAPLLERSRVVVHAASASTPGSSAMQPLFELEQNLRPTLALLQALQNYPDKPLIYLSSGGALYDGHAGIHADESAPVRPRSYHGAGKAAAEHFIGAWCHQCHACATIVRPSNLYGPGQAERAGFGVIPAALGKLLRDEVLPVWGDGSAERDYLYIDDFIELCLAVIAAPAVAGMRVVNACHGDSVSLNTLFDTIERATGRKLQRRYDPSRSVDAPRVIMDGRYARKTFAWSPSVSLQEGIERTWKWFSTIPR